jgi:hypothetical protein
MDALKKSEDQKTEEEIARTRAAFSQHKEAVIAMLLDQVVNVTPQRHRNFHI